MRCKACSTVWLVTGPGAANAAGLTATPLPSGPPMSIPPPAEFTKRAAVLRRGNDREVRDMFAPEPPASIAPKETLLPPPSAGPPPSFGMTGVGARNETSVLFRVDQLSPHATRTVRSAPAPAPPPPPAGFWNGHNVHDEGVIDLQALSSAAPRAIGAGMPVAPLFSEPPPVTLEVSGRPPPPAPSRMQLAVAALAGMALLAIVGTGIAFAFRGEQPKPVVAAVAAPPPAPPPPPAVTVAPAPAPVDSAATSDDPRETRGKKLAKGRKGKGVITNRSAPPAAKSVPKANPCGCNGDFNCILACTAKGGK